MGLSNVWQDYDAACHVVSCSAYSSTASLRISAGVSGSPTKLHECLTLATTHAQPRRRGGSSPNASAGYLEQDIHVPKLVTLQSLNALIVRHRSYTLFKAVFAKTSQRVKAHKSGGSDCAANWERAQCQWQWWWMHAEEALAGKDKSVLSLEPFLNLSWQGAIVISFYSCLITETHWQSLNLQV